MASLTIPPQGPKQHLSLAGSESGDITDGDITDDEELCTRAAEEGESTDSSDDDMVIKPRTKGGSRRAQKERKTSTTITNNGKTYHVDAGKPRKDRPAAAIRTLQAHWGNRGASLQAAASKRDGHCIRFAGSVTSKGARVYNVARRDVLEKQTSDATKALQRRFELLKAKEAYYTQLCDNKLPGATADDVAQVKMELTDTSLSLGASRDLDAANSTIPKLAVLSAANGVEALAGSSAAVVYNAMAPLLVTMQSAAKQPINEAGGTFGEIAACATTLAAAAATAAEAIATATITGKGPLPAL